MTHRRIIPVLLLSFLFITPVVFAATVGPAQTSNGGVTVGPNQTPPPGSGNVTLINPLGTQGGSLIGFLGYILDFAIRIGTILIIITMVYIGFQYVWVARNNPNKISDVHQMLLWTIVGALILLGAKALSIGICQTVSALSNGSGTSCVF